MTCPFSQHLPLYGGPRAALEAHVRACNDCRATAAIAAELTAGDPTPDCVDVAYLHAYLGEMLSTSDPDDLRRSSHIASCGYCQRRLLEIKRVTADQNLLATALRQGDAYLLARDLATWLGSVRYPKERTEVDRVFDETYEGASVAPAAVADEPAEFQLAAGLALGGSHVPSVARRIAALAALVGRMLASGSVATKDASAALRARSASLDRWHLSGQLLADACTWLDTQYKGP